MDILKGIVLLAAGAGLGFIGGKLYYEKKYEKISDNEIKEVKEYYKKKTDKIIGKSEEINAKLENVISQVEKTNYNKVITSDHYPINEEEEVKAELESPEEEKPDKPYVITEEEFLEGNCDYDKISLTYFELDDTLADDSEEVVDIEETISTDIYNELSDDDEDKDWYVRNDELQTDFEIMKVEGSYSERMGMTY